VKHLFRLIYNENIKLYLQRSTQAMLASLIALTIFSAFIMRIYAIAPEKQGIWGAMSGELWLMFFINIFSISIASGIVANEFNWGTIKFLLIRPFSRSKILLSKYITVIIFSALLTFLLFIFSFATNSLLYTNNLGNQGFSDILMLFLLKYPEIFMYSTIAFMLSVLSKSSSLALGFSLVIVFIGPIIAYYLPNKYLLFSNVDLTRGDLRFSIAILLIYTIIFNFISWIIFLKRDITR